MGMFKKGTLWLMAFLVCFMFALPAASETPNARLFIKDWDNPVNVAENPTADPDLGLDKVSAACLDENNNMIVAWIEDRGRGNANTDEVYIQKLSASDGERQFGDNGRLILEYDGSQYEAIDMVCIGNFAYVVGRTENGRVYIQKVDLSNGDPLWGTPTTNGKQVDSATDDDGKVYLLYNGGDSVFVAYEANSETTPDVRASLVNIQTGNVTHVGNVYETDVFTQLVAFGLLPAPSNAAWAVVVYSGAGTGWYARKINADGTMGDQITIYEKTENADTETAFILPDGQNGALIVASYSPDTTDNNYRISVNGIKADGNLWNTDPIQLSASNNLSAANCQLYAATFMEEGSPDYISLLWSEDAGTNIKLQKFKIGSLGEPKWTAAFDVDATTLQPNDRALDTDDEGESVKMADLASGHIAITWEETDAGNAEDIFVLGVGDSEDETEGVCLFNPEDNCLVFDAGDNETTVENTLLLPTGSAYSMILFDPDTTQNNDQRYRVMRIDVKRRPDITFTTGPAIDPDELVANEDNDITITDQIENQGQVPAEDIVIRYYLTSTNNVDTFLTTAQKLEIGSRTVASLGIGEGEPSTQDTQVTITKDQISTAFSWNPEDLYIAAYANEDNIEEEGDVYDDNNIEFVPIPDANITAPDLEPSGINCPGTATAGDTITLTDLQINNMNATGAGQAVDDAPVYFYLSQYDGTNLAALKSHRTTRLLKTTTVDAAANTNDISIPDVEVKIPPVSSSDNWYIYIVPDAENVVAEWDAAFGEANNVDNETDGRCQINITGVPDYLIDQLTVTPETADVGEQVTVSYVARNQGEGDTASATTIEFYFSRDEVRDDGDTMLGSDAIPWLGDNESYANSILLDEIPAVASGTYYIIAYIVPITGEPDENNQRTVELDVRAGDMVVTPDTFCLVPGEVGTANITGGAAPYTAQSSNTDVATVAVTDSTLSITAVGTGSADITVTDSLGQKYRVSVEVNEALTLSENEVNLSIGGTADVDISGGCPDYSAESSNEAVATCTVSDSTLTITGIAEGDATITVSDSAGHTASLTAHVYPGVVVNPDSVNVVMGGTFDCTVSGGLPPYFAASDNPSIATGEVEDSTLRIVGVEVIDEEPSSTTITVSDILGQEFDVAVNVYAGIVVNPDELNIYVGDSATATISSAFVRGLAPYSVSCEDTSIATASVDGDVLTVTGVGAGSTICTVSDQLNSTFDVKVNVSDYVDLECSALILNPDEVEVGGSFTATYGVSNVGTLSSPLTKVAFYLSEDETLDDGDEKLAEDLVPSLNPGEGYVDDVTLTIPEGTQPDGHYILAMVDPDNEIAERLEDNNLCSAPVTVIGRPPVLDITANTVGGNLVVKAAILDAGDYAGQTGTFAIWATHPTLGCYTFYWVNYWLPCEDTQPHKFSFTINVGGPYTVLTMPAVYLPTGTYTFHLAVDVDDDGTWDVEDTCTWTK